MMGQVKHQVLRFAFYGGSYELNDSLYVFIKPVYDSEYATSVSPSAPATDIFIHQPG